MDIRSPHLCISLPLCNSAFQITKIKLFKKLYTEQTMWTSCGIQVSDRTAVTDDFGPKEMEKPQNKVPDNLHLLSSFSPKGTTASRTPLFQIKSKNLKYYFNFPLHLLL